MSLETQHKQARVPLWRNVTFLKWAAQIVFLIAIIVVGFILYTQGASNLEDRGVSVDFDFIKEPPGIALAEGIDVRPPTGGRALFVGIVNMMRVTVAGILAATILGVILGISRLSHNWIVNKVATVYIETIRNIPLLVQIIFWSAIAISLGELTLEDAGPINGWLLVSNKGISFAWLFPADGFWQWFTVLIIGFVVAGYVFRKRAQHKLDTGAESYPLTYAFGTVVLFGIIGWWAHPVMGFLGSVFGWVADGVDAIPVWFVQLLLAALSLLLAGWWIKRFLDKLRTPAGLGKLTDDDYFRLISTGALGLVGAFVAWQFAGIANTTLASLTDFFNLADSKFDWLSTGSPLDFRRPSVEQPGNFANYGDTGMTMTPAFFAVFVGVTIYTAAFIAEIVRGGILAISRGQTEAGLAVGLRRSQLLRMIILPQAFRIILPPMGNQYLNLAKNTSLGIAVAYPEVVQVGQTIYNQTGSTIPVVLLWMGFYLSVSLSISFVVNWYNRRVQLVER